VLGKGGHKIRHFVNQVSVKFCGHILSIFPFYDFSIIVKNLFKRLKEKYLVKKEYFCEFESLRKSLLCLFWQSFGFGENTS